MARPRDLVVCPGTSGPRRTRDASGPGLPPFAEIRKTWAGPLKESLTSADNYTVKFTRPAIPPDVRVLTVMVPIVLDLARYGPV